jgi:hypothetical protein
VIIRRSLRNQIPWCRGGLDGLTIPKLPSILQGDVVVLDSGRLKKTSRVDASSHLHLVPALHVDCVDDVQLDDPDVVSHRAKVCVQLPVSLTPHSPHPVGRSLSK